MSPQSAKVIKIFYCYAHEDRILRDELEKHLDVLRHQGKIGSWYDREILPGASWEHEIVAQLGLADIVLLLVSPDFMHSKYCWEIEMKQALQSHEQGTKCVIPVLLRPVYWQGTPIETLQLLPTGGKAITSWPNRDEAFEDVTRGIVRVVDSLLMNSSQQSNYRIQDDLGHRLANRPPKNTSQLKSTYSGRYTCIAGVGKGGSGSIQLTNVSRGEQSKITANLLLGKIWYTCDGTVGANNGGLNLFCATSQPRLPLWFESTIFPDGHMEGTIHVAGEDGEYSFELS